MTDREASEQKETKRSAAKLVEPPTLDPAHDIDVPLALPLVLEERLGRALCIVIFVVFVVILLLR